MAAASIVDRDFHRDPHLESQPTGEDDNRSESACKLGQIVAPVGLRSTAPQPVPSQTLQSIRVKIKHSPPLADLHIGPPALVPGAITAPGEDRRRIAAGPGAG